MPNLFEGFDQGPTVFVNEPVLSPEFQPEVLPGREAELAQAASLLKPLLQQRKAPSILVYGVPGTGKTCCVKHVLKELKDYSSSMDFAYVNCWTHPTRQGVLTCVSNALGQALPRRGLASDEVFDRIASQVRNSANRLVIALDEADRLFFDKQEQVLYDFARGLSDKAALVFITNDKTVFSRLDDRMKSSLAMAELEFKKYSPDDLKKILSDRAGKAFRKNACSKEIVGLCAGFAAKNGGDARIAIESLWLAGRSAEKRCAREIGLQDCRNAFAQQESLSASKAKRLQGLSPVEKQVLERLQGKEMTSGELYSLLPDYSERILRSYVNLLANKKLVEVYEIDAERGKTRVIKPLV